MARFVADVPLNMAVRLTGIGSFTVCGPVRGHPLPAGEIFECPDNIADAFLAEYGPRPPTLGLSAAGAAQGLIPGLRRV